MYGRHEQRERVRLKFKMRGKQERQCKESLAFFKRHRYKTTRADRSTTDEKEKKRLNISAAGEDSL